MKHTTHRKHPINVSSVVKLVKKDARTVGRGAVKTVRRSGRWVGRKLK